MLPLAELVPRLPPRRELGRFPSPLEEAPSLAARFGLRSLLVKREDRSGPRSGGNKLRSLEWVLPQAGPAIVTMGAYGSSWCAALSREAGGAGHRVFPALFPQPWSPTVAGLLSTTLAHADVSLASRRLTLPLALARARLRARRHGRVTWLPAGGATPLAALGAANAALELLTQCRERNLPEPEAIVVPYGSGGTAAGLLVGLWAAGVRTRVVAVRVTDPWYTTRRRVLDLARRTLRLLAACGRSISPGPAELHLVADQLGSGYGLATPAAQAAATALAEAGVPADLTYSAKAGAALAGLADSFARVCFWHTFDPRLVAPLASDPLIRQAEAFAESLWPHPKSS